MKRHAFLAGLGALALPARVSASVYDRIHAIARSVPGTIGVYCRTLAPGKPVFEYNPRESFPTASTIKLLILATAFAHEEAQPGTLAERITTHRSDLIGGSDFMDQLPDGARVSVGELLVPMITVSDNTASNCLISFFGFDAINATASRAGLQDTFLKRHFLDYSAIVHHNDNVTTPHDMATLLYLIAHGAREGEATIVSPEHCRRMLDIMLGQTDRDAIPAGLPPGTQVANKTGEIDGTRNDVAVVEPFEDSPYVLTIFSKWVRDYGAIYQAMHRIARLSYHLTAHTEE